MCYAQFYSPKNYLYTFYPHFCAKLLFLKGYRMQNFELGLFWEQVLEDTKKKMPLQLWESTISSWLIPLSVEDLSIHIGVTQDFIKNIIEKNPAVIGPLQESIDQINGSHLDIIIMNILETTPNQPSTQSGQSNLKLYTPVYDDPVIIDTPAPHQTTVSDSLQSIDDQLAAQQQSQNQFGQQQMVSQPEPKKIDLSYSNLIKSFRFETFVAGNSNRIPFGAAQAVAENPGNIYNPLFIYGPSGLGKTHLMHAIGNYIIDHNPNLNVMCITSEKFMNTFVDLVVRGRQGDVFRNIFRNIDVLLVDDIQFLENKEGTKNEFFNTFNELLDNQKQIVLTSDTLPNDMNQLEDRLRSRFQAGFIATMDNPDLETRIAIVKSILEKYNISLTNDAVNYVAYQFSENVRVLQGAVNRLVGVASLQNLTGDIDYEFTKSALEDLITEQPVELLSIEHIQDFVSSYFSIKKADLLGKKRKIQFAFPRQIAMYLCRDLISESYPQIAAAFTRDHTTILHAYEKISKEMEKNPETARIVNDIKNKLNGCG